MKQRILVCLTLALLLVLGLCGTALAANVPEVSVVLSENRFSGPQEVTVTITVANTGDTDMPGPVALYDPDGKKIDEFGTPILAAGASKVWTGTWMVTDKQLDEGRLSFGLGYTVADDSGVIYQKTQTFYSPIVNTGATPDVQVTRTITPPVARQGQKVYVTYEVTNVGGLDVTGLTIKESSAVSSTAAKLGTLAPGESASHTFTIEMKKKDLISHAAVTYSAAGQDYTRTVDEATIKYGKTVELEASLKADKKGGTIGDVVKLTLTLKNTGKNAIQNITVTDPVLGTVFSGLTVEGKSSLTQEKEITILRTGDYLFSVSGANASGSAVQTATEMVHVIAVDPEKAVSLSVTAEADKPTIYMLPGIVKFTVHVTNTGSVAAENVTVSASNVELYSFASIAPGATASFVRDVRVDIPGKFRFDAQVTDPLGQPVTFQGNEVPIRHAPPTATPTQAPIATPAIPTLEQLPTHDGLPAYMDTVEKALDIGFWVLLGISGLFLALVVVGVIGRSARAAKSGKAADHLERSGSDDYTVAVPARKRRFLAENEDDDEHVVSHAYMQTEPTDVPDPVEPAAEEPSNEERTADMQETMNELYPEARKTEDNFAPPARPSVTLDTENTYQRRRRTSDDE